MLKLLSVYETEAYFYYENYIYKFFFFLFRKVIFTQKTKTLI